MRYIQLILLLFTVFISNNSYSQSNSLTVKEQYQMNLMYQLGFIQIPSGEIWIKTSLSENKSNPLLILEAKGYSLNNFELFFKYSSTLQSNIDVSTSQLTFFERKVNRNDKIFEETYTIDNQKKVVNSKIIQDIEPKNSDSHFTFKNNFFDILSATYYFRFIKYESLKISQKIPFNLLVENTYYSLYIKYLGIEKIELPDKNTYVCYKISVQVVEGSVFKGGEALLAWVSADKNRILVQMKSEIIVGSVIAYVTNTMDSNNVLLTTNMKK